MQKGRMKVGEGLKKEEYRGIEKGEIGEMKEGKEV